MPRPAWSTGCQACRKMKVKCGEEKPSCSRCKRAGRNCPGYRDVVDMRFLSMNTSVKTRSTNPEQANARVDSTNNASYYVPQLNTMTPSTIWEQHAVARFLHNFVEHPLHRAPGYLEFLPQMLQSNSRESQASKCIQQAVKAVSMANLANISSMHQLEILSQQHYGWALRALQGALKNDITAIADETLTAIYLLQKYEIVSGSDNYAGSPHEEALKTIFRLRGERPAKSSKCQSLYRIFQIRKQIEVLNGRSKTTMPKVDNNAIRPIAPGDEFWVLLQEASESSSNLQQATSQRNRQHIASDMLLKELLLYAWSTHTRLVTWSRGPFNKYRFRTLPLPHIEELKEDVSRLPKTMYLFDYIQHGAIWIAFWCAQIHLAQAILNSYHQIATQSHDIDRVLDDVASKDEIIERLISTVVDVCASAPYLLGDVDGQGRLDIGGQGNGLGGFFLLRALVVANSVEDLPMSLRCCILDNLTRIGTSVGIKKALRYKEDWLSSHPSEAFILSSNRTLR